MTFYPPVKSAQRPLLALLATSHIHVLALTTSDLVELYPRDVSRRKVVQMLRDLEAKDYVEVCHPRADSGAIILTWEITTKGLRVALGVLT